MKQVFFLLLFFCLTNSVMAVSSLDLDVAEDKHHITADRTLYHSKEKVYEAFGHVVISSKGKRLSADYVWIDTTKKELKARGNVIFVNTNSIIQASEIHYNLETQLGSIFYGSVSNDLYTLKGQLIRRISEDRFLTTEGEYTTCKDCPESWKLSAKNVDITFDGYAFMDSVFVKIKDTPTVYLPYLVMPVKTRRQTGLLFPKISTGSSNGFSYVQPLFIAIDKHQDATIGLGTYSSRGKRMELEYRYKSYDGIEGTINFFRTKDRGFKVKTTRTALHTDNHWSLWKHADIKWRIREVSDQRYISDFTDDIIGNNEPALESNFVWYAPFKNFFISAEAKRYRNLLYDRIIGFDGGTVQAMPSVYFGSKEAQVFSFLSFNLTGRYDDYTRHNGAFQDNNGNEIFDSSIDTLRQTRRFLFTPEIATPFRIADIFSISPSVQYNEIKYIFPNLPTSNEDITNTSRRYLLAKVEASTVMEKIFQYNGEKINRVKHQLIPFMTYTTIPWQEKDDFHPFTSQLEKDGGLFDQFDIVPIQNSTDFKRLPLGNAVSYGFSSRVIRKFRGIDEVVRSYPFDRLPKKEKEYSEPHNRKQEIRITREMLWDRYTPHYENYEQIWDLSVSQAYDFKEANNQAVLPNGDKKRAFSLLQAKSNLDIDDFSNVIEYKFYPRVVTKTTASNSIPSVFSNKHALSTTATWYLKRLKNARGTLAFRRSISINFSNNSQPTPSRNIGGSIDWSFNDFFSASYGRTVDLLAKKKLTEFIRTIYSSPSECWQIGLRFERTNNNRKDSEFGIDLGVNLMGSGYVGVNQFVQSGEGGPFGTAGE